MQQNPSSDELDRRTTDDEHHLCNQHQVDIAKILIGNTKIDNRLRKERQEEFKKSPRTKPYE